MHSPAHTADARGSVAEYVAALKGSTRFGPQVVAHRVLPAAAPEPAAIDLLAPELQQLLENLGIRHLHSHQHAAIEAILAGRNTVVATPTASGKSFIYTLPILQTYLCDPDSRALCLFPLKALAQDQLKTMEQLWRLLPERARRHPVPAAIYDGDTTDYRRRKIRELPPPVLITNPDMLHLGLLPHHAKWGHFFAGLRHVVVDEVHTYRGVFGSHVAWVLRRLKRICALYGADPTFVLASATIGNPGEHARLLIDAPTGEITRSGAGRAARHVLLLNPLDSAATTATLMLEAAVSRGLRTIVYCQSRKMTELITIWTGQRLKERQPLVASYRSGFLPEERRQIEARLAEGSLLGVISTSALELGIDIGHLDICLLVGYPGSMMATWQRAGRVGRQQRESLVVLIGHEDALDQHFMRNPEDFFNRPVEPVTMNPDNPYIAGAQLVCAAAELPLTAGEPLLQSPEAEATLRHLTEELQLLQSADGTTWFSPQLLPQRHVNLRGGGPSFAILELPKRVLLGTMDGGRVLRDCHPGAIYLHMARTFHVDSLDLEAREILVRPVQPPYFTRPLSEKTTEILREKAHADYGSTRVRFGTLRVTERITGYQRVATGSLRVLARVPLDLPPQVFETEGFWVEVPDRVREQAEAARLHFMGGIHAMEHALIGLMPLLVLCDRGDLGGISHPWHDQAGGAAVFVYDGYTGGMGLTARAFAHIGTLLDQTRQAVAACGCELGCPSCVHSPKCGSGNRPIDKQACLFVLDQLAAGGRAAARPRVETRAAVLPATALSFPSTAEERSPSGADGLPARYGVFDVETQRSAQEVGGWHRAELMRVSVAVLYESDRERFTAYTEEDIHQMIERLFDLDLVIGFNNKRFDNRVLSRYTDRNLGDLPSFDILEAITNRLGYRLSLDRLAEQTLRVQKTGDGLLALRWFRQGEMARLTAYCQQDVAITRDLFLFGLRQRYLLFRNKAGAEVRLPVDFATGVTTLKRRRDDRLTARPGPCAPSR